MRMMSSRWLWGIVGIAGVGAVWAYRRMQGNKQAWRNQARTGRTARPSALRAASRAGRAVVDTTMRTVRAINRM